MADIVGVCGCGIVLVGRVRAIAAVFDWMLHIVWHCSVELVFVLVVGLRGRTYAVLRYVVGLVLCVGLLIVVLQSCWAGPLVFPSLCL